MENNYCKQLEIEIDRYLDNLQCFHQQTTEVETLYTNCLKELETSVATLVGEKELTQTEIASRAKKLYETAQNKLKSEFEDSELVIKYKDNQQKVDVYNLKDYPHIYYKNLLEVVSLMPNQLGSRVELPSYYSAHCKNKFDELSQISIQRELIDNPDKLSEKWKQVFGFFEIPNKSLWISDDTLMDILAISNDEPEIYEQSKPSDELFIPAVEIVMESGIVSAVSLQRKFSLGYARAANIIDEMEKEGIIDRTRKVIITRDEYDKWLKKRSTDAWIEQENLREIKHEIKEFRKKLIQPFIFGNYLQENFLLQLKDIIQKHPDFDLPEIIISLRTDELEENIQLARELFIFRDLYRETPMQALLNTQNYYFDKLIDVADDIRALLQDIKDIYDR